MTTENVPAGTTAAEVPSAPRVLPAAKPLRGKPAQPSFAWCLGAFLLAGAAQLITISAMARVDPLPVNWWSLLLAIAPAPLTAIAALAAAPANRLAAVVGVVVLIAGIIGGVLHTGLLFLPALIVLAIGAQKLWRELPGG
jgi:hypothetical protein